MPCSVMWEVVSNMVMAAVVPGGSFGVPFRSGVLSRRSHCEVPSGAGHRELGQRDWPAASGKFVVEASLVRPSGSNGRVKRSIQSAQDQVRVLRVSLQDRWKVDEVGPDRTLHERVMAEKAKPLPMEFGELVQWRTRPVGSGALGKLDSVWERRVGRRGRLRSGRDSESSRRGPSGGGRPRTAGSRRPWSSPEYSGG